LPWPTSLHALHGLSCPAATTTGQQLFPHNRAEKTPSAWKRCALPLSRTTTTTKVSPPKSARSSNDERTVTTACPQPDPENGLQRPTDFEGRTRAQLILARRTSLQLKAVYICADLSSRPNFPLQSCGGPYIAGEYPRN
jgi:hypothetical protein